MSRSGSKVDIFVKLSLVLCLMLLAFSMGTYVGKQVSDTDYKQKQLEVEYAENMNANNTDATPAVNDEEIAALAEDMVKAERTVASENATPPDAKKPAHEDGYKPMNAQPPAHDEPAKPAHKDAVKTAAERVAESLAPAADPKQVRQPSTQLPTVATSAIGKYTVQVASYASEPQARDHTAKLKEKGFPAFYVPADVQGRNWYRVSVGLFAEQKAAMDYRQEILKSQATSTAIVQRIVK